VLGLRLWVRTRAACIFCALFSAESFSAVAPCQPMSDTCMEESMRAWGIACTFARGLPWLQLQQERSCPHITCTGPDSTTVCFGGTPRGCKFSTRPSSIEDTWHNAHQFGERFPAGSICLQDKCRKHLSAGQMLKEDLSAGQSPRNRTGAHAHSPHSRPEQALR
jgi:hypothetical protein